MHVMVAMPHILNNSVDVNASTWPAFEAELLGNMSMVMHHPALAVQCGEVQCREVVRVVLAEQGLVHGLVLPHVAQHGGDALDVPEERSVHDGREAVCVFVTNLAERGVRLGLKQQLGRHRVADLAGEHQGRLAVVQRLVDLLGVEGFHQLLDHAEGAHCREAMGVRA